MVGRAKTKAKGMETRLKSRENDSLVRGVIMTSRGFWQLD
jgi:hypothetical protein